MGVFTPMPLITQEKMVSFFFSWLLGHRDNSSSASSASSVHCPSPTTALPPAQPLHWLGCAEVASSRAQPRRGNLQPYSPVSRSRRPHSATSASVALERSCLAALAVLAPRPWPRRSWTRSCRPWQRWPRMPRSKC